MELMINKNVVAIETKEATKVVITNTTEIFDVGSVVALTLGLGNGGMEIAGSMFRPWK